MTPAIDLLTVVGAFITGAVSCYIILEHRFERRVVKAYKAKEVIFGKDNAYVVITCGEEAGYMIAEERCRRRDLERRVG